MPFHDGSGNFVISPTGTTAPVSEPGSDLELDSRHSRHYQPCQQQHPNWGPKPLFYQDSTKSASKKITMTTMKGTLSGKSSARSRSPSARLPQRPVHGGSRLRDGISMYDSEEEDMRAMEEMNALVVDIPSTMGWLQVFEHALNTFRSSHQVELLDSCDSDNIKALASGYEDHSDIEDTEAHNAWNAPKGSTVHHPPFTPTPMPQSLLSSIRSPILGVVDMIKVRRQMSALALDTLKRLQTRHYSDRHIQCHHQQYPRYHTDDENRSSLLAASLSALRQIRDHVKSNLLDPALDEELSSDLSTLGIGGDLGMTLSEEPGDK
ncbi:hypothetical protein BGX23_012026 [Mortierella sp. AD031]|nr:hypothetical protein BGX23_012026 [Mortierella sp. AD031]